MTPELSRGGFPFRVSLRVMLVAGFALAVALCGVAPTLGSEPEPADSLRDAFTQGDLDLGLRYRFEFVEDDNPIFNGLDATASTLRTTLRFRTKTFRRFTLDLEFEDVTDIGSRDKHNNRGAGSLSNGVTDRPVIADPDITDVNRINVGYAISPETSITLGRQRLAFADQRFVGPVGWRQNFQTIDGVFVDSSAVAKTKFTYGYFHRVHRIFGDDKPMHSHALESATQFSSGKLRIHALALDFDRMADAGSSTTTWGLEWSGTASGDSEWRFPYRLGYAQQADGGDNTAEVDADYYIAEVTARAKHGAVRVGYEVLEGEPGSGAFSTPLATLHKFNGWADKFLATPPNGLSDLYISVSLESSSLKAELIVHDFSAESGSGDYGSEIDGLLRWKAPWKQTFVLKMAIYNADEFSFDTTKAWLMSSVSF